MASGESNGYSRINPSIMSSASEFPRCGAEERLEIIKQSGTSAAVEGGVGRKEGRGGGSEWVAGERAGTEGGFRTGKSNSKRQ